MPSANSTNQLPLVKYEQARAALSACIKIDEAMSIKNKAHALLAYAQQSKDTELERWASQIRLRAMRRIGELARGMEKGHKAGKGKGVLQLPSSGSCKADALADAGLTPQAANRCEQIASIPDGEFEQIVGDERSEPLSVKEVLKKANRKKKVDSNKAGIVGFDEPCCEVSDLHALALTGQKFGCIYLDPPWQYGNQGTRAATDNHYSTMTNEDIAALPIGELAAGQSHLHLWTTNAFLVDAIALISKWGFEFKSTFVWVKPQLGIGNYWRCSHEILLLGVRGTLTFPPTNIKSWIEAERAEHSAKPEKVRQLIETVSPGPRLELFARTLSHGWHVWGNQIAKTLFDPTMRGDDVCSS